MCKSVSHWASAYVGHCAKDYGFQDITTGDFRCKFRAIRMIGNFRGIIKLACKIL